MHRSRWNVQAAGTKEPLRFAPSHHETSQYAHKNLLRRLIWSNLYLRFNAQLGLFRIAIDQTIFDALGLVPGAHPSQKRHSWNLKPATDHGAGVWCIALWTLRSMQKVCNSLNIICLDQIYANTLWDVLIDVFQLSNRLWDVFQQGFLSPKPELQAMNHFTSLDHVTFLPGSSRRNLPIPKNTRRLESLKGVATIKPG